MLKKFFITLIVLNLFLGVSFCFSAGDPLEEIAKQAKYDTTGVTDTSLSETIGGFIRAILGMVGVIFFALTFYAGYLWLTASGSEDQIEKAKSILTAATIGLIIVFLSYGLTSLVLLYTMSASAPINTVGN